MNPDLADLPPDQMTRAQLVRAITAWREDDTRGYDDAIDLLVAAQGMLERVTYADGIGGLRCELCKARV